MIGRPQGEIDRGWQDKGATAVERMWLVGQWFSAPYPIMQLAVFLQEKCNSNDEKPAACGKVARSHESQHDSDSADFDQVPSGTEGTEGAAPLDRRVLLCR